MALTEQVVLDIARAEQQIATLERQLTQIAQPVIVPIDLEADNSIDEARRDLERAEGSASGLNAELSETDRELRRVEDSAERAGREIDRAGTRGASSFKGLAASAVGFVGAIAAFQGFQALGRGLSAAVTAASDFEESISKSEVVFGQFADEIQGFAREGPRALGLSTAAALEATATFGNLFVALGLSQDAAAALSPEIVQLGADLASFNNIAVDEAIIALRAGLVGEVEPLRRLGVAINAAAVEAKALELGFVDSSGAVTEAGKVQARYALILEQTGTAQGDFARTADGIANTQKTLKAEFQDVSAAIGQALLPAYEQILEVLPGLVSGLEQLAPVIGSVASSMAGAVPSAQSFGDVLQFIGAIPSAVGSLADFGRGIGELAGAFPRALAGADSFFDGIEGGIDQINAAVDNIALDRLQDALVDALQAGVDPAKALGDALVDLTNLDLNTGELQAAAAAFTQIAGVDAARARDLRDVFREQGEAIGLEAQELGILLSVLNKVFEVENKRGGSRGAGARRDAAEQAAATEQVVDATLAEADALAILEGAADTAGVTIAGLLASQAELPPELAEAAGALSASTLEYLRQVDAINALDVATGALPGTIEAAADAMRTEENEIVSDFGTFLDNLRTTVAQQQEFDLGLSLLRALGLDDLAAQFEAAGVEALDLVNDALANPDAAREAERLLDGQYVGVGTTIKDDILEGLEGQEINTALINKLIEAAEQANTPEVKAALLSVIEELQAGINQNPLIVPLVFSPEAVRFQNEGGTRGSTGGLTPQGNVEVNIVNPTTNDLVTDAARAAQTIDSVVRVRSGAQ